MGLPIVELRLIMCKHYEFLAEILHKNIANWSYSIAFIPQYISFHLN